MEYSGSYALDRDGGGVSITHARQARRIDARGQPPSAMLPCPACAASVKAENLARHLDKTHPESPGGTAALPSRLRVESGAVTLRRRFALGHRRVTLPAEVEVGSLVKGRISAGMTSYADGYNVPHDDVRSGTYLRLSNGGSITIACRTSTASADTGPAGPSAATARPKRTTR
jgi:hypothetical protein